MKRLTAWVILPVCAATVLAGCAPVSAVIEGNKENRAVSSEADKNIAAALTYKAPDDSNVAIHDDGFVVPLTPIGRAKNDPEALKCDFGYNPKGARTLDAIAKRITDDCNLAVHITADAQQLLSGVFAQRENRAASSMPMSSTPGSVPPPPINALATPAGAGAMTFGLGGQSGGASTRTTDSVNISYSGPLKGFLDAVTGQLGLSWRFDEPSRTITIFYTESRTFTVAAIAGESNVGSSVQAGTNTSAGNSSSGGGSSGGTSGGVGGSNSSTNSTDVTSKSNTVNDLKTSVDALLTPGVGIASPLSPSTGTITVTDTPEAVERIANVIDNFNARLTKQMRFNVLILNYTGQDDTDGGFQPQVLYTNLLRNYSIGIAGSYQGNAASSSATLNILNGNSKWSTSQAVFNALNEMGHATIKTASPVSTLNLSAASVQVAENTVYLASSSVTGGTTTGSATQSALQPGSFTVGYNLQLLPFALSDDRTILLQLDMNLSSLKKLRQITSNGSSLEAPDINQQLVHQKVRLRVGQTLMLSGFQQTSLQVNTQGTGLPGVLNYVFGGGANTSKSKDTLVILITPTNLD